MGLTASAWKQRSCIPAAAGLGKSRFLVDKECLLTDQRWAEADVELHLEYLGGSYTGLLLQGMCAEGNREEFEANGGLTVEGSQCL